MIRFDKKWFNPLYFILNEIAKDDGIRLVLVYGGKSSAKTVSICQFLVKESLVKHSNVIAFRKESVIIKTTLQKSFNLAIDNMFANPAFERLQLAYRCNNGSEVVLKGLDDSEKAKGIESYRYLYLDELNHFEYDEFEQFNLSLRGIPGQKIFGSWNPVDENSWVKKELVDKYEFIDTEWKLPCEHSFVKKSTCGKVILIKTTYEDNYWIAGSPDGSYGYRDENLISEYNSLKSKNFNRYRVNVLGEWGKVVFGGEFLKNWKSEVHVGKYSYNPNLAIRLVFDENVNPYFPCGIFQIADDYKNIFMIHAIALRNPENNTKSMGREIARKLREWGHAEAVFIGGDPTSQKEDVKQEKGHDLFKLMMLELKEFSPRREVLTGAPSVRMSADFFNTILDSEFCGLRFRVDEGCRIAISDFENTKEDKNGKVDKKTEVDKKTGVSYQPWGHFVDLARYFLVRCFEKEYHTFQHGGSQIDSVAFGARDFRVDEYTGQNKSSEY